jgi:hypothetical protein
LAADPSVNWHAVMALWWVSPAEADKLADKWIAETNYSLSLQGRRLKAESLTQRLSYTNRFRRLTN